MSTESDVLKELREFAWNKAKLMQHYSDKMMEIQNFYGGNVSDIPANSDHEYHDLAKKLRLLNLYISNPDSSVHLKREEDGTNRAN